MKVMNENNVNPTINNEDKYKWALEVMAAYFKSPEMKNNLMDIAEKLLNGHDPDQIEVYSTIAEVIEWKGYRNDIPKPIKNLTKHVIDEKSFEIVDWDLDRVYLKSEANEMTIRMWNITADDIRWTLFVDVPDEDGGSHGEELESGIFEYEVEESK
jgi:antitoxin component HigA of HigAB toxin-antitoxin module